MFGRGRPQEEGLAARRGKLPRMAADTGKALRKARYQEEVGRLPRLARQARKAQTAAEARLVDLSQGHVPVKNWDS